MKSLMIILLALVLPGGFLILAGMFWKWRKRTVKPTSTVANGIANAGQERGLVRRFCF